MMLNDEGMVICKEKLKMPKSPCFACLKATLYLYIKCLKKKKIDLVDAIFYFCNCPVSCDIYKIL